jgi:hypothetical protein
MPLAVVSERQRKRAKQLRQTMTRAETLLWRYVKANRIDDFGFRRRLKQHLDAGEPKLLTSGHLECEDGSGVRFGGG